MVILISTVTAASFQLHFRGAYLCQDEEEYFCGFRTKKSFFVMSGRRKVFLWFQDEEKYFCGFRTKKSIFVVSCSGYSWFIIADIARSKGE